MVSINSYTFQHRDAIFWGNFIAFYQVPLLVTIPTAGTRTVQVQYNPKVHRYLQYTNCAISVILIICQ